jgi:RNA polymerase sigma-70 factor (ECF subfamily)
MGRREIGEPVRAEPVAVGAGLLEHAPALRAIALGLCRGRPASDADDLVQDTFERALRHFSANAPPVNLRAYLISILRHAFVDRVRATRIHVPCTDDLPAPEPPPPSPLWGDVSLDDVRRALRELDPSLREPFELHYLRGKTYAAVAAALGIPQNTVASRLYRARAALRPALLALTTSRGDDR